MADPKLPGVLARAAILGYCPLKFKEECGPLSRSQQPHGWIRITKVGGKPKLRPLYKLPFLGTSLDFSSFTDTLQNALVALLERVFFHEVDGVFSAKSDRSHVVL